MAHRPRAEKATNGASTCAAVTQCHNLRYTYWSSFIFAQCVASAHPMRLGARPRSQGDGAMANVPDPSLVPADAPFFVGRERERRLLGDRLRAALDGRGGLALVGGAAGIGKTALARVVGDEAAARDIHVLAGRCYDLADAPPYGPWRDLLAGGPAATGLSSSAPVAGAFPDDMPS
jgi:hypothetical protein